MSDMTAYRSPHSDSKDTADQTLVTKDYAEHTYVRLAHTRAIRPTQHDDLSESHRTPHTAAHQPRDICLAACRYLGDALLTHGAMLHSLYIYRGSETGNWRLSVLHTRPPGF